MVEVPALPDVVQLAVPGFIVAMLVELLWSRGKKGEKKGGYETRDTLTSLLMGGGNLVVGMLFAGPIGALMVAVSQFAPFHFAEQDYGWHPLVFVLCFVIDDLRYYVYHRAAHEVRWFWGHHVTHHSSQHYNLSTALRQPWGFELSLSFLFRLPLVLLGFDPLMLAFVGGLNLIYQFWIHTEYIGRFPAWFEAVFNSPSHHRVHHAVNPRYLDANYAGTLIIWDRMFGSFVEERSEEPTRYGLVHQIGTYNPLRVGFHEWVAMFWDVVRPGLRVRERLGYVFGPPGWSHDGRRETSRQIKERWRKMVGG
jgi:sterol desaturase/sphingolipid hydroxylase (fatty acid hydroxylase superfamily)